MLSQFPSTDTSNHSNNVAPAPPPGPDPHCRPPAEPSPALPPQPLATDPCSVTPQGSIFDTITRLPSPTSANTNLAGLSDLTVLQANFNAYSPPHGSVIHIRRRPRIFGLGRDCASTVFAKLINGGANICVTGDLSTLVNVKEIPPMRILVAIAGDAISSDDC